MYPRCPLWQGVWGSAGGGGNTSSSQACLVGKHLASWSRWEITYAKSPSSLSCGPSHSSSFQQRTTFQVLSMKASTSWETLGVNCTPLGLQVLPLAASPMCWRAQAWCKSYCCWSHPFSSTSSSKNCPMFRTVGEGRQMGLLDTFPVHLQVATSHLVRSFMAASLPSVSGLTSSHQLISPSSSSSLQTCSHLVVCYIGSTHCLVGEHHIILCWWNL